jgi:ribose/xylose/arabinose/galactoside ABC-type transport system permease subunit
VLWLGRFGTVVADAANGWELLVVSAVVVGGVAITGGIGTVYGAALGGLLLTTIGSVLVVLKVNSFWQDAITGVLLLLAISVDRLLALRVTRALRQRSLESTVHRDVGAAGPGTAETLKKEGRP